MEYSLNGTGTLTSKENQPEVDPYKTSKQKEKHISAYTMFDNGRKFCDSGVKEKVDDGAFRKVYVKENKKQSNLRVDLSVRGTHRPFLPGYHNSCPSLNRRL